MPVLRGEGGGVAHGASKVRSGYVCLVVVLCFGVMMLIRIAVVQCADNVMYVGEHRELMLVWRRICVDTLDTRSAASGVKAILR
jgi:hypothetical protein